jgi:hypothetical protein
MKQVKNTNVNVHLVRHNKDIMVQTVHHKLSTWVDAGISFAQINFCHVEYEVEAPMGSNKYVIK